MRGRKWLKLIFRNLELSLVLVVFGDCSKWYIFYKFFIVEKEICNNNRFEIIKNEFVEDEKVLWKLHKVKIQKDIL